MAIPPEVIEAARRAFVADRPPPSVHTLERIRLIVVPAYRRACERLAARHEEQREAA